MAEPENLIADLNTPAASAEDAINSRRSIRRFLADPVPKETVEHLLAIASRAPSGTNIQPWRVYAVAGKALKALSAAILKAYDGDESPEREYNYYPLEFTDVHLARRRKVGWDLYGLLDIGKGDKDKMHAQHGRNFQFFDAPVGLMFTIERSLQIGSWLDYGMFLQNIMIAARGLGLHTCPQAAFANYHAIIRDQLGISKDEVVVCGISLGYADPNAVENTLVTEREPVEGFTTFIDF
ncbi:MAG: nitroreductase [Proteobacteria bacterium]|nr:nitroreductase [Pseudomonadota bacterium]